MKITVETIPHNNQRYQTIGDYWWEPFCEKCNSHRSQGILESGQRCGLCGSVLIQGLVIRVSETGNWKYEALVALHEFIEVMLCKDRGIEEPHIKAFDEAFEASRPAGDVDSEPGDDPKAPYGKEHRFAENLERLFAAELGVNWAQYDADLCKIWHPQPTSERK